MLRSEASFTRSQGYNCGIMLKRLAILAVALSVASAFATASWQASNKDIHDRKDKSQPANASANPSPTATPVAAQDSSGDSLKSKSDSSSDNHQQAAINISNSAALTEWTWHDKVAWFFGLVLTGFLVWGVIVARRTLAAIQEQTKETARAAKAAEDAVAVAGNTARRQLRAYLCVSEARLNFRADSQIKGQIEIKNTGQTPAYEVRTWIDSILREHPLISSLKRPTADFPQSDGIIGPGRHQIAVTHPLYGKEIDFGRVYYPGHAFYVYGECSYRDIFEKRHVLSFRMILGGPAGISMSKDADDIQFGLLGMDIAGNEERDED
jgi:hypothetical protein